MILLFWMYFSNYNFRIEHKKPPNCITWFGLIVIYLFLNAGWQFWRLWLSLSVQSKPIIHISSILYGIMSWGRLPLFSVDIFNGICKAVIRFCFARNNIQQLLLVRQICYDGINLFSNSQNHRIRNIHSTKTGFPFMAFSFQNSI
jgi:hypothetical protein